MLTVPSLLSRLFFTGRRVRLTPMGAAKLLVPITVIYGIVLKLIESPGQNPMIIVGFETIDGSITSGIYTPGDLEMMPVSEAQLREDLLERKVHFPRSSGIGIAFPPDATDYGIIKGVRWEGGKVRLVVWVEQDGVRKGISFVTPADFTQCDLVSRKTGGITG